MFLMSGRPEETIAIGEDVQITVLGISPSRIHLGIATPREVSVDRIAAPPANMFDDSPAYAALGAVVDASEYETDVDLAW